MKFDSVDFIEAHQRLIAECGMRNAESTGQSRSAKPIKRKAMKQSRQETMATLSKVELDWLERATRHYHSCLLQNVRAQEYLKKRGLVPPEIVTTFRVGFVDGSLLERLNEEGRACLQSVGLLNEKGGEMMRGCVVFPLVDGATGQVVNLYGRHIERKQHLYLPGERRGLFNPSGAKNAEEVIVTESVIDALALWSVGLRSVIPVYGTTGLTDEIVSHLSECRVRRVVLMLDSDEAGRVAALEMKARLEQINIASVSVELPEKDAAEFVGKGGTADEIRALIEKAKRDEKDGDGNNESSNDGNSSNSNTPSGDTKEVSTVCGSGRVSVSSIKNADDEKQAEACTQNSEMTSESLSDGTRLFSFGVREYRVRGLSAVGMDRLKVNVRLSVNGNFHLDTLDLYQSRSRASFAHAAAKLCNVPEQAVNADLLSLIESLEAARLEMRNKDDEGLAVAMTGQEKQEAMAFLKDKRLCERIVEDFRKCGLVGERATVLTSYLGAVSRKLSEPLALLIVARSGAGKSALQDALCAFVPPEELVRVTRLTGQALFYKDPYSLQRKMLVIAEDEGAQAAVYSLRTLASDQRLSIAATRTDPATGKLHTEHYEVFGPVVIVITTTAAEAFDEETRSRFVQLTMNESIEQTRAILSQQRRAHTLDGVLERATAEQIKRLHHNCQRLLKPLSIVNPFVEMLTYPSDKLIHRREQRKYLALINSIALLHQHQREIKRAVRGDVEIEYVEVELSDIALANELASEVLSRALDELAPPVRSLYQELQKVYQHQADEMKCKVEDVQLSRREIREATSWSDWQVRSYCQRLVEMEYLFAIANGNGKPAVYQMARVDNDTTETLRGLTSVDELKRRINEKQQSSRAAVITQL
jgi:DNA primase